MQEAAEASDSPTRARIMAAAEERFAAFGYRRTGIAELPRDAGVAPGTLYRYFENKEEIFRAVMREGLTRWLETARRVLAEPGTALERLARLGEASVDHNRENALINSAYRRDGEIIFAPLLEELHEPVVPPPVAPAPAQAAALAGSPRRALAPRDGADGAAAMVRSLHRQLDRRPRENGGLHRPRGDQGHLHRRRRRPPLRRGRGAHPRADPR